MNEFKSIPILFKGPMVNAILDGSKTQTRRAMKPQPVPLPQEYIDRSWTNKSGFHWAAAPARTMIDPLDCYGGFCCPHGSKGNRLWVRETFAYAGNEDGHLINADGQLVNDVKDAEVYYKADYEPGAYGIWTRKTDKKLFDGPWRPSIFMPRWASRITLLSTEVRVQRLQEITEEDAVAEGVGYDQGWEEEPGYGFLDYSKKEEDFGCLTAKASYRTLWDSINGKSEGLDWASNPWTWVIDFERIKL